MSSFRSPLPKPQILQPQVQLPVIVSIIGFFKKIFSKWDRIIFIQHSFCYRVKLFLVVAFLADLEVVMPWIWFPLLFFLKTMVQLGLQFLGRYYFCHVVCNECSVCNVSIYQIKEHDLEYCQSLLTETSFLSNLPDTGTRVVYLK